MKTVKSSFFIIIVTVVLILVSFFLWIDQQYVVPILTYHHVGHFSDKGLNLNTVSTESFDQQMAFLKKYGYKVISFDELVEGLSKKEKFSHNTVVIHFDDGYKDNYTNAFPILKKYQFPAMVFLVSDSIGTPGFLTWDQVKEMDSYDFWAGSHTRTHTYLPKASLDKAKEEIVGSKRIIEEHLGHSVEYFAYPSGGFTSEVQKIVQEAGYKAAGTTNRGNKKFDEDLYAIQRIRVNEKDADSIGFILWAKCSGYYNLFRKSKSGGEEGVSYFRPER